MFTIGLGKTGTTSLHLAFHRLGLRSYHWGGRPAYHAVLRAQREGARLLHHVGESSDAYSDIETLSVRFDLADLQYPGSRFILTVRDVDGWVSSRRRHAERNLRNQRSGAYPGSNVSVDEEAWRMQWHTHIDRVSSWFHGRDDDLLVLDVCAGDGWERLAPFLGRPVPHSPFPRENVDGSPTQSAPRRRHRGVVAATGAESVVYDRRMSSLQPSSRSGFERHVTSAWRSVRQHLPSRVAEAIRVPSKRVLRRLGAINDGKSRGTSAALPQQR